MSNHVIKVVIKNWVSSKNMIALYRGNLDDLKSRRGAIEEDLAGELAKFSDLSVFLKERGALGDAQLVSDNALDISDIS